MIATLQDVIDVPVPNPTATYQPLSNYDLVTNLKTIVNHYGMQVTSERFELGRKGNQLFGVMTVKTANAEMEKCIGFRNSYDKTLPVGFVAGASVIVCSNLMFVGDIYKIRKHTANLYDDFQRITEGVVSSLDGNFNKIQEDAERLKTIIVSQDVAAKLAADMYMTEELITISQLSVFKQEWDKRRAALPDIQTGWDVMNHFTESLKKSHPSERMENQIKVHNRLLEVLV